MRELVATLGFCVLAAVVMPSVDSALAQNGTSAVAANHDDFFSLLRSTEPDIGLSATYVPSYEDSSGGSDGGELQFLDFTANAELLRPISHDLFGRFAAEVGYESYDFSGNGPPDEEQLYRVKVGGGAAFFLTDNLLLTGIAYGAGLSDFDGGVDEDDLTIRSEGLIVGRLNPYTELLAGLRQGEEFTDLPLLPLFGLRLLSEDGRVRVTLTAPVEARLDYMLTTQSALFAHASHRGERYRVHIDPRGTDANLYREDNLFGVGATFWFWKALRVEAEGGLSIGSRCELTSDEVQACRGEQDPAGYVKTRLGYSF